MPRSFSQSKWACSLAVAGLFLATISRGSAAPSLAGLKTEHIFALSPFYPHGLVQGPDGDTYGTSQLGGPDRIGTVFKITAAGRIVTLYSFGQTSNYSALDGGQPETGLTLGPDGNFYGTTAVGGVNGNGTVFRITPQGALTTLYHFGGDEEANPTRLVLGSDGNFYGTTTGRSDGYGTAFRISPSGVFTRLHRFSVGTYGGYGLDGGFPGPLIQAKDGNYYGIAATGGTHGSGTLFRMTSSDGAITAIYNFQSGESKDSRSGVVEIAPGEFYGTSAGSGSYGKIFRVTAAGGYTTLHSFTGSLEFIDSESLVVGGDGNLYGACPSGDGSNQTGVVFRMTPAGDYTVIHQFTGGLDGKRPRCGLLQTGPQTFRGITLEGGAYGKGTFYEVTGDGIFSTVAGISDGSDGTAPLGPMIEAENGDLYGSTTSGGLFDSGTIFRLSPEGELTTLYNFTGKEDGAWPSSLAFGPDGSLYGITTFGSNGYQTAIFKVSLAGDFTAVRPYVYGESFDWSGLVRGKDANFYLIRSEPNAGALVRMTPAGDLTVVHNFNASTDGSNPYSNVTVDNNGFLYGATPFGGANGKGTIYRCSAAGDFTVLHHFASGEGQEGGGQVVVRADGNLYGTTIEGGADGFGIIYRLAPDGTFKVLYDFGPRDGFYGASLVAASDGYIYGTSSDGGDFRHGILFQIAPDETVKVLYSFTGGADGGSPGPLMEASNGRLYGPAGTGGGTEKLGILYSLPLTNSARLFNISTRMKVLNGENVLIAGFIITGSEPKKVIIRGIGPSLGNLGLQGALENPTLELHQGTITLAANDDWKEHEAEVEATTIPPGDERESAIVTTLDPGAYTAVLAGKGGGTGLGVVELYDLSQAPYSQLVNISSRGFVDTDDNILIAGVIAGPNDANTSSVLIRALGPSLQTAGVVNVLQNPMLELRDGSGALLATNDDWKSDQQTAIDATGVPPTYDEEAALVAFTPPGSYTAIVRGKANSTGIGLVEVYRLQ